MFSLLLKDLISDFIFRGKSCYRVNIELVLLSGPCEEKSIVRYGGCSQYISWTGDSAEPNWEESEYFCFKLVGYDGLLK